MKPSHTKPARINVWGDSLLNKLPSISRQKRKRTASKKTQSDSATRNARPNSSVNHERFMADAPLLTPQAPSP